MKMGGEGGEGEVDMLIIKKTEEIWISMKTVQDGLGVKNMSDLILKQIHRIYETETLQKKNAKCKI